MRRADRLIEMVGCLKARSVVRAEELAAHLEVSVRTVYRDLASLQGLGLPIEGQAGVGFMLRGDIHLPPIAFDHDELEALALGLAYVEQVGDPLPLRIGKFIPSNHNENSRSPNLESYESHI